MFKARINFHRRFLSLPSEILISTGICLKSCSSVLYFSYRMFLFFLHFSLTKVVNPRLIRISEIEGETFAVTPILLSYLIIDEIVIIAGEIKLNSF